MSEAVDALRAEHRVIERALDALAALAESPDPDLAGLEPLVEFFRTYADRWHHGREEDLLFAILAEEVPHDRMEPLVDLLEEHEEGRRLVAELAVLADGRAEPERLPALARSYVGLLRTHIAREDEVLFPLAEAALSEGSLAALDREFARYPEPRPPEWR